MEQKQNAILSLLESKDVDELTAMEMALVTQEMTLEAYNAQRAMIKASRTILTSDEPELKPNPAIREGLRRELDKRKTSQNKSLVWLNHRIPTYQAVAATLVLVCCTYLLLRANPRIVYVEKEVVKSQRVVDTLTVLETRYDTVITQVKIGTTPPKQETTSPTIAVGMVEIDDIPTKGIPAVSEIENSFGNTTINAEDVEQFRVSM
ncbi:MAG: hypothetical protein JJ975_15750 [Bacteroidia bacterium]|nr:hypothetical protein [Bacteroidia bacterium]